MERRSFYNEILTEHNLRPEFKHDLPDANITMEGVNPSCGDHIWLKLKVKNGVIEDGAFVGDGCAISQASADIMLGMIIGRKEDEARRRLNCRKARCRTCRKAMRSQRLKRCALFPRRSFAIGHRTSLPRRFAGC